WRHSLRIRNLRLANSRVHLYTRQSIFKPICRGRVKHFRLPAQCKTPTFKVECRSRPRPSMGGPPGITELLIDWNNGSAEALQKLMPMVETELRRIAANHMRRERPGHTLQTSALVNEAYL